MRYTRIAVFVFLITGLAFVAAPLLSAAESVEGKRVSFTLKFVVTPKGKTTYATVTAQIPQTIEGRQKIIKIKYSQEPRAEFARDGCRYVQFIVYTPQRPVTITIDVEAEIYRSDLATSMARKQVRPVKEDLKRWCVDEEFLQKDAPEVQDAANTIAGKNELETVREIIKYVGRTLKYTGWDKKDRGAVQALREKQGCCSEFADVFVTLCRAKNIPARICTGYVTGTIAKGDTPKHRWAEVYLKDHGWVPFDPLQVVLNQAPLDRLPPIYIYFSQNRKDAVLNNHYYWTQYAFGDPVRIEDSYTVIKQQDLTMK